jgi:type IV pilus assembly protein PilY1
MASQTDAATTGWTVVRTDMYNVENNDQRGSSADYVNLAANYPDRVWCKNYGDAATGADCRQNSGYDYPNYQFLLGNDGNNGNKKYIGVGPYYYSMQTARYCNSATPGTGTTGEANCKSGSQITTSHTFRNPELCSDTELTDCRAGSTLSTSDAAKYVFSGVRWCNNAGMLEDTVTPFTNRCQRKKIGSFLYPKHLGVTASQTGTFPAIANEGQINVTGVAAAGGSITQITIGGTTVFSGTIAIPAGSTPADAAALIRPQVDAHANYNATQAGASVVITQQALGSSGAGAAITVTANSVPTSSATGGVRINSASGATANRVITEIRVNGVNLLCTLGADVSYGNSVTVKANPPTNGRIEANAGWNTDNKRNSVRDAIIARVNACAIGGYSASIDTGGVGRVTLRAPLAQGAAPNGHVVSLVGTQLSQTQTTNMGGGASSPSVSTTTVTMNGGADAFTGTRIVRRGVGVFSRTDILPGTTSYPRTSARSDCLGTTCTYEEEMTNFANWYTYYRSRMKMMKTAAGRAFENVDDTFRVGFITINPTSGSPASVQASKYLKIGDFTTPAGGHKQAWYTKFYSQDSGNSTPLREALSRVGWIFAGKLATGLTRGIPTADDPVTASCQPSFAILSTDGYWNGNAGQKLDGTAMDNQDNVDAGYSKRADGAYDGNLKPTTVPDNNTSGGSGTLADVAMYYYKTDLRTPSDAWAPTGGWGTAITNNNVPVTNKDNNATQHMVTFTIGLGLDGTLTYRPDYETAETGDFLAIKQGTAGANWPSPQGDEPTALDDLWHAAVNGRGVFFSAQNPQTLSESLLETLAALNTRIGAGAAAATSNLQPIAGDNFAFTAQYQTVDWIGDLKARTIDLSAGIVSSVQLWSAAALLDGRDDTSRRIYTFDSTDTTGNLMKHFCWPLVGGTNCSDGAGLTTAEQAYFVGSALKQWPYGGDTVRQGNATGDKIVLFLRGDRSYETTGAATPLPSDLFRSRTSLLGDIINAQPAYVRKSPFAYSEPSYDLFKKCTEGVGTGCQAAQFPDATKPRLGTVFAAANDGMLHAFETDVNNNPYFQTAGIGTSITSDDKFQGPPPPNGNGEERWAYIPGIMLPQIRNLADIGYQHRYFTDGSPAVGDICLTTPSCASQNDWRTILVAGFNSGGSGYYALDVTNPSAPKALWEFRHSTNCFPTDVNGVPTPITTPAVINPPFYSDCHLGLSYGNPIITKRKIDNKWVVIVSSGYNNNLGGGDGKGYLYVLEAHTGRILNRFTTGVGSAASPSGLAKINGWTTSGNTDNTTLAIYGGDLQGNLWRFQLDSAQTNYLSVTRVAQAVDPSGVAQPITVKPELGQVAGKRVILFGTGRFLQDADPDDTQRQTIYALRDEENQGPISPATAIIPDVRAGSAVRVRTLQSGSTEDTRTVAPGTAPTWASEWGWLVDLPDTGERVNVDPQLQLGTLVVASNVPDDEACTAGGTSWINFLDYATGGYIQVGSSTIASQKISASLTVGINVIMLPGGGIKTIATTADNQQLSKDTPVGSGAFAGRRVSWRELVRE